MLTKGQAMSIDFVFASAIFLLLISFIIIYWSYTNIQISETENLEGMVDKVQLISEVIFSEGYPVYWHPADVINLGLQNDNRLNRTKIDYLNTIGYPGVKRMIGVGGDDFYFRVYDQGNQTEFEFGAYPTDEDNLVRLDRIGILDEDIVSVEIYVWN